MIALVVIFSFDPRRAAPSQHPSKSLRLNSFADPHPLNSVLSIRYEKGGRGGYAFQPANAQFASRLRLRDLQTFQRFGVFPSYLLSFQTLANSFALNKNSTLFFSINSELFAKNHPGWGGDSSHFGTRPAPQRLAVLPSLPCARLAISLTNDLGASR
jgi:hypothetical protein